MHTLTHMESRFNNPFVGEQEDAFALPEGQDSPPFSSAITEGKFANISSPKRRRALQRRVVSVPIGDAESSRLKGEGAPPSDSWAWRKYGQKPIKGSPYPRGYYRCSSSKGCPARKQVERSRADPTMLVITYACDHNHPWPTTKSPNNPSTSAKTSATVTTPTATSTTKPSPEEEEPSEVFANQPEIIKAHSQFAHLSEDSAALISGNEFTWFSDMAPASPTMLESPLCAGSSSNDSSAAEFMSSMGKEDESLFADLGELPECSVVFRRAFMEKVEEEQRQCSLRAASWCESSG
ncbi:hypothetical protein Syun_027962 [Stephania yunnanensis]|uniref:WRKY domain-containing protein n=1 Tax=Stephania yunnanensis TaxID=152371 RepID=A0AAP0EGH1_9MAGN